MTHPIRFFNASAIRAAGGLVLAVLFGVLSSFAQVVRPVIVQHKGKVIRGKIELVNDGVVPMAAVAEAKSFQVTEEGELSFHPLDRNLQVKLSAISVRIPPKQTQILFYEAKAETLPAWFVIYSTFALTPPNTLVISWDAVTAPPPGFPAEPIHIVGYQVIVGTFQVTVPATTLNVTVSPEFVSSLASGQQPFEVLAIEAGGNQTITEGSFTKP